MNLLRSQHSIANQNAINYGYGVMHGDQNS